MAARACAAALSTTRRSGWPAPSRTGSATRRRSTPDYRTWGEFLEVDRRARPRARGQQLRHPHADDVLPRAAPRRLPAHRAAGPALRDRHARGRRLLAAGARRPAIGWSAARTSSCTTSASRRSGSSSPPANTASCWRPTSSRFEEKWGRPWEPYERRPSRATTRRPSASAQVVGERLPAGTTVLVVSKGDERAAEPAGSPRHGTSPRRERACGPATIRRTAQRRSRSSRRCGQAGPSTWSCRRRCLWWLDHYEGLRDHLESTYQEVVHEDEAGVIFALNGRTQ